MGRLINAIFGKQIDVRGVRQDLNVVVAGFSTRGLRLLETAQSLWARFAGRVGIGGMAPQWCYAVSAVPCAMAMQEPSGSSHRHERRHGRQRIPGHPRHGRGF